MPNLFSASDRARVARSVADAHGVDYPEAMRMVQDALSGRGDPEHDRLVAPFLWGRLGPAAERLHRTRVDAQEALAASAAVPREVALSRWAGAVFGEHPDLARLDRQLEHFYGDA
ncbi:hypothetical protein ABZ234_29930 [Nocardiopsis sp. NPDC006198]|uniref:hypothetical protein n=1 Tax=Nocardiopsis sp. NPDC006198 TaxID=3154472 RepID=UPI0033A11491